MADDAALSDSDHEANPDGITIRINDGRVHHSSSTAPLSGPHSDDNAPPAPPPEDYDGHSIELQRLNQTSEPVPVIAASAPIHSRRLEHRRTPSNGSTASTPGRRLSLNKSARNTDYKERMGLNPPSPTPSNLSDMSTLSKKQRAKMHAKDRVLKQYRGSDAESGESSWSLYPFWSTDPCRIRALGEGVVLFFRFLKRAMFWYFLMAGAGIAMMYLNYNVGGDDFEQEETSIFLRLTPGNLWIHGEEPTYLYGGICAGAIVCFALLILTLREDWRLLTERTIRTTAASYSVRVKNLPKKLSARRLLEWASKNYGPVESICVVTKDGDRVNGVCSDCQEYCTRALTHNTFLGMHRQVKDPLLDISNLPVDEGADDGKSKSSKRRNLNKSQPKVNEEHFHTFVKPQMVIITFVMSSHADKCIFEHRKTVLTRFCCCFLGCGCMDCHGPFFFSRRLHCSRPREPSDYHWDNFSFGGRNLRLFFSLLLSLAVVGAFGFGMFWVNSVRQTISTNLSIAIGVSISILNLLAEFLFLKLTIIERHKSKSALQLSMISKKLAVELINNIAVTTAIFSVPDNEANTEWYRTAGTIVTSIMIADAIIPNVVRVFHPVNRIKRALIYLCSDDQERLNEAYVPQLTIYNDFIAFMSSLTWVFVYFSVLPIALPITFVKVTCLYLIEKYNVLRRYGKPEMVDDKAASMLCAVLPWTMWLSSMVAVIVLRAQESISSAFQFSNLKSHDDEDVNITVDANDASHTFEAQRVVLAVFFVATAFLLLTEVFPGVLSSLGIRWFERKRASRYKGTCCWGTEMSLRFTNLEEQPYHRIPGIEHYVDSHLVSRHRKSSADQTVGFTGPTRYSAGGRGSSASDNRGRAQTVDSKTGTSVV